MSNWGNGTRVPETDRQADTSAFWLPLVVTGSAMFVFALDAGLLSVIIPEIEDSFPESSRATISWVGTAYSVAGVAALLIGGRLGDRYGRRRIFRLGMLGFAVGSAVAAAAPNVAVLLAARTTAGAFGALYTAVGLALALREIPDERKALAVGFWGFVGSVGFVLGPLCGGAIISSWSWRLAFAALAPVALGSAMLAGRVLHEYRNPEVSERLPLVDAMAAAIGAASVAVALSQSGRWGLDDPRVWLLLGLGITFLVALVVRSRRPGSLLDHRLLQHRPFLIATAGAGVQQLGFLAWWVTAGIVLREVWQWTVLETGYALSVGMVVSGSAGLLGGRLAGRFGYVGTTVVGSVLAGLGPLIWATSMETRAAFWSVYLPGLMVFMLGAGMSGILPTGAALAGMPAELLGGANAAHSTVRRLGASIGLAVMAALLGEGTGGVLLDGARAVFVMVAVTHLGLIPFMLWYGRSVRR